MEQLQDERLSEDFHLLYLKNQACEYPPDDIRRKLYLTHIIRVVMASGRLWKNASVYYEDALQMTWVYCCKNLCEAVTAKSPYDSSLASIVTWLNGYLKWRLHDLALAEQQIQQQIPLSTIPESALLWDADLSGDPASAILDETHAWVEADSTGELQRLHVKDHPHITAQYLILKRLPPEVSWRVLSDELQVPISTLSSFYQRHCLPNLRKFGIDQGYI